MIEVLQDRKRHLSGYDSMFETPKNHFTDSPIDKSSKQLYIKVRGRKLKNKSLLRENQNCKRITLVGKLISKECNHEI